MMERTARLELGHLQFRDREPVAFQRRNIAKIVEHDVLAQRVVVSGQPEIGANIPELGIEAHGRPSPLTVSGCWVINELLLIPKMSLEQRSRKC